MSSLRGLLLGVSMTVAALGAAAVAPGHAQVVEDAPVRQISVTLNKSKTLTFKAPFSTAVIGSPDIATLVPMSDHTLYVQGKKVGTTNISVFDNDKHLVSVVDLDVSVDAAAINSRIAATTGSGAIKVSSSDGQVVLSGEATDAVSAARAVDVAKSFAPKDGSGKDAPVVDAMRVASTQQVMLNVRFLEVNRTAGRDLGVNLFGRGANAAGVSGLGLSSAGTASSSVSDVLNAGVFPGSAGSSLPFGALLAQVINTRGVQINSLVSALEDKGLAKSLAEPDLITQSGEKASFFAGSQIPVPTVQPGTTGNTPNVSVSFYQCGVNLNFDPTVLNNGLINVHLAPQVCQVANTSSVIVNGTQIPELNTRSADTTVELRDGQSFAVAGLLQAQDVDQLSQLPWVGNVPVLGALFRSTNYQKAETDLVVIVSVHLVKPVAPGSHLATPFDDTLSSNDIDLFLMGDVDRKKAYTQFVTSGGDIKGPYGHILEAK